MVSHAFSVLCVYSKFAHHPHTLGYLCAKFHFFHGLRCLASPWRKLRTQSLTQLIWCPGNRSVCASKKSKYGDSISFACLGLVVLQPMSLVNNKYLPVDRTECRLINCHQLIRRQQHVKLHAHVLLHTKRLVAATDCTFLKWKLVLSAAYKKIQLRQWNRIIIISVNMRLF